jgi:hypothetical protein
MGMPYDPSEPAHHGHLVRLLAPNHPPVYVTRKGGHHYTSVVEADPTNPTPGSTRFVAYVWPWDVAELLAADPPYSYPDEAPAAAPAPVAPQPMPAAPKAASTGSAE